MIEARVYWDRDIYRRELESVFRKAWLFIGLDAMIPQPGDFVTNHMGDDPVILCRDRTGHARVLLNRCRHRGNKVCLYDEGTVKSFRCSYHGWTYTLEGKLTGVPQLERYASDVRLDHGLLEAPKVESYKGLIFASWDQCAGELSDYLGDDLRWYLDCFVLDDPQGLESLGFQRCMIPGNWKHLAENFGGDLYHFVHTHASVIALTKTGSAAASVFVGPNAGPLYSVSCTGNGAHPPHGVLNIQVGSEFEEREVAQAESVSQDAVDWVRQRYRRRAELVGDRPVRPGSFNNGNIWPNLSFNGLGSALHARSFMQWHPRGPEQTEMRQWCFVEKSAPPEVKEYMGKALTLRQSATGLVTGDDIDNFQRMRDVLHTSTSQRINFNYDLDKNADVETAVPSLPGHVFAGPTEGYHRDFYRFWSEQMEQ